MPAHRISFSWSTEARDERAAGARSLAERLRPCALDRAASARDAALEAARELAAWLAERPRGWGGAEDLASHGAELEQGLSAWVQAQAWRGACGLLVEAVRAAWALGGATALVEELAHWSAGRDELGRTWDGVPLSAGERLPGPEVLVPHALRDLERGDHLLVLGRSEAVLAALGAARRAGLEPRVTVAAGTPDHSGRRVARHLVNHGLAVRLIWDAAALGAVSEVDRVWLGTEAVGAGAFLGLVGSRLVAEEALRREVPLAVLATDDACVPGGALRLPTWGDEEGWSLWSQAPEGVELASQPFERVPAEAAPTWITCAGRESLAALCTRALRLELAPPCGPLDGPVAKEAGGDPRDLRQPTGDPYPS
jgi:hypothetical protein